MCTVREIADTAAVAATLSVAQYGFSFNRVIESAAPAATWIVGLIISHKSSGPADPIESCSYRSRVLLACYLSVSL